MKARIFTDKSGKAFASVIDNPTAMNEVPLDVMVDDDTPAKFKAVELTSRDLLDVEGLLKLIDR